MPYTITNQCIGCSRCLPICPTHAIEKQETGYQIDPNLCNNCVGFYPLPQCVAICPTNGGCVPDGQDYWKQWFFTYNRLVTRLQTPQQVHYWESWFNTYSQEVFALLQPRKTPTLEAEI